MCSFLSKHFLKIIRTSYGDPCYSNTLMKTNNAINIRIFSSKKLYQKKPDPKRPKVKSKLPEIKVWQGITFGELGQLTNSSVKELFSCLSQITDEEYRGKFDEIIRAPEHIATLAAEMGFRASFIKQPKNVDQTLLESLENEITMELEKRPWPVDLSKCHPRPPVVTIMGHVDHGKTTLLDYLRKSEIVKSEFGGITQHIGAFSVKMQDSSNIITFLDTPGHAAFKSMRARGARVTDMVVLVVAADDGIMEQTVESIKFARDASVPIIVAISKCDKRNVDIQSVKLQLMSHNLVPEEYGGEVQVVPISALKGTGIEQLKEAIMTQAEIMDLRAETDGPVEAAVIESKTIHGKGKAASLLIRRGTLKKGRFIVAGQTYCCVRAMYDQQGNTIAEASPSTPVEVTGWKDELPSAGDEALEVETEKRAKDVVGYRKSKNKDQRDAQDLETVGEIRKKERELYTQIRLENIEAEIKNIRIRRKRNKMAVKSFRDELKKAESNNGDDDSKPEFNIIVKADVHGSLEAILEVCNTYNSGKCDFDVIYTGVGPVTGNDLELAETFKATIYAFNTATPSNLLQIIKIKQISLKPFNIIYRMVEDLKTELSNRLPPVDRTDILGEATVLRSFKVPGKSGSKRVPVAGCRCTKGTIVRKAKVKVMRLNQEIFDGEIESMQKGPEPLASCNVDDEVGLLFTDVPKGLKFQPDDQIVCYRIVQDPQVIDWYPPGF